MADYANPEVAAMAAIFDILNGRDPDEVRRILTWLTGRFTETLPPARSGKMPITDDLLRLVARLYREAVDLGEHPRGYIAARVDGGRASSTVARWILMARDRGFLGPATGTRAGEAPRAG